MGKALKDYTFEEQVEWAQGYILKELLKGNYESAVHNVCAQMCWWRQEQDKKEAEAKSEKK